MFAVRLVGPLNVTPLTAIPGPKLTVEPALKFVFDPVMRTLSVWFCKPLFGAALTISGAPVTTKEFAWDIASTPVTSTVRPPTLAPAAMVRVARAVVGDRISNGPKLF